MRCAVRSNVLGRLATLALLGCVALFAISFAAPPPARAPLQAEGGSSLEETMERIRGDMKRLAKELEGKEQAAAWKTVCSLQRNVLEAKLGTPTMAASKPEAERPAFVTAFRAKVSELLKATCDLEAAVLAGKYDKALEIHKEIFGPLQKAAHKQFRDD